MPTKTALKYNIVTDEGDPSSVTVFIGGKPYVATKDHASFIELCRRLDSGDYESDEQIAGLFDVGQGIVQKFEKLSDRVSYANSQLYLDGDPMRDGLAMHILALYGTGSDLMPFILFLEKLQTNPGEHSKESLFRWMEKHKFGIAEDGDIIAYKGVNKDGQDPDDFKSVNAGTAFVNGVRHTGKIPNRIGTVVEMPRSEVEWNPRVGCSTGLHVANWRYASSWGGPDTLRVKLSPRDVVSVPTESNDEKMRVCRYYIVEKAPQEDTSVLFTGVERTAKVSVVTTETKSGDKDTKVVKDSRFPKFYDDFKKEHWELLTGAAGKKEMLWLAKEWGIEDVNSRTGLGDLRARLAKAVTSRKRRKVTPDKVEKPKS